MKRIKILLSFIFLFTVCHAQQNKSDSLKIIIETAPDDTVKVNLLLDLSKSYFNSDPVAAIFYGNKAKTLAEQLNFQKGAGYALKNIGLASQRQGKYVDALDNWQQSLKVFESINFKLAIANLEQNLGTIYFDQSDDEKAWNIF